ncbi:putative leader peptide [Nocardioides zhouii]
MSATVIVPATVGDLLTQRRAVDLARTASALCPLSRAVD